MTNTEKLVCDGLVDLLQTTPFLKIRTTWFVRHMGISRSTFYNHFDSLDDVLRRLEDGYMEGLGDDRITRRRIGEAMDDPAQFEALVRSQVEYVRDHRRLVRAICGPNGDPAFQARMAGRTKRLLRKASGGQPAQPAQDLRWEIFSEYAAGGQWYLYRWCAFQEEDVDPGRLAPYFAEIFRRLFDEQPRRSYMWSLNDVPM